MSDLFIGTDGEDNEGGQEMEGAFNQPWAEEHGLQLIGGLHKQRLQPRRR